MTLLGMICGLNHSIILYVKKTVILMPEKQTQSALLCRWTNTPLYFKLKYCVKAVVNLGSRVAVIEIRCPRCGSPCTSKDRPKGEYRCDHCGATFHFIDSSERTVVHDARLHNCPLCGRPVKTGEGFICKECGREYICPKCVDEMAGRFVCKDCLREKWIIVGPSQKCPKCNGPLTYVPQYNRWYCYYCKTYAKHVCFRCGGAARYIPQYNSWYCDICKEYLRVRETRTETAGTTVPTPPPQPIVIQTPQKSGCFIATAAYGTPMTAEISVLRQYRDERLEQHLIGKRLVKAYYRLSPIIAGVIVRSEKMRAFTRLNLNPILHTLKRTQKSRS